MFKCFKLLKIGGNNCFLTILAIFTFLTAYILPAKAAMNFNSPSNSTTIEALVEDVSNWFLSVTAGLAILFLIIGGIYYLTAFGDDKRMEEGKKIITYAIYGLVLVLISYSVVLTVNKIIFE